MSIQMGSPFQLICSRYLCHSPSDLPARARIDPRRPEEADARADMAGDADGLVSVENDPSTTYCEQVVR
jgi:hypothetical protein